MLARVLATVILASLVGAASAEAANPPRVLVYSGTAGYRHASIPRGIAVLERLAGMTGRFSITNVDQPGQLTKERLGAADIVLWLSTTGGASPFSDAQESTYIDWVSCGGGHMGIHASTDSYRDWPAWAELTGAFFKIHPITLTSAADDTTPDHEGWGEPQATILVTDQESPTTAPWRGKSSFLLQDEFYALDRDPSKTIRDFRVTLAFGGFTNPVEAIAFGGNYAPRQPLAWTGSFRGLNRLAYTNLGHSAATWNRGDYQDSLIETIGWIGAKRPDEACLIREKILPPKPAAKKKPKAKKKKRKPAKKKRKPR